MKNPIIVFTLFALAGCSSKPGNADIENFLKPVFSSCENIKFTDASKTNGYGDDEAYHVKFSYTLKVDLDKLNKLHSAFVNDKSAEARYAAEGGDYRVRKARLEEEIEELRNEYAKSKSMPTQRDYAMNGDVYNVSSAQIDAYNAARADWQAGISEYTKAKRQELDDLKKSDLAVSSHSRTFANTARIGNEMWNFYSRGCTTQSVRLLGPILGEQAKDATEWFDRRKFDLSGEIVMRKTEQGWRVIGSN